MWIEEADVEGKKEMETLTKERTKETYSRDISLETSLLHSPLKIVMCFFQRVEGGGTALRLPRMFISGGRGAHVVRR